MFGVQITGLGAFLPEKVLTNKDLEKIVDTTDEWIRTRTGITKRHIAAEDEATSDLGSAAAQRALENAGLDAAEIELIVVATLSPDKIFPNTGCFIQKKLKAVNACCFSLEAACSGFVYGMEVAAAMIRTGLYKNALVVGAEKLSTLINWNDRSTCVLFGDGAGAAILQQSAEEDNGLLATHLGSNGNYTEILHVPGGGSRQPISPEVIKNNLHYLHMSGKEVFKLAVNNMANAASIVLEKTGMTIDDIKFVIPHQANTRIISSVGKRLGVDPEKTFINVHKYGNTSAASIPIAFTELIESGQVNKGDYLILVAFGGGLTWGASLIKWTK